MNTVTSCTVDSLLFTCFHEITRLHAVDIGVSLPQSLKYVRDYIILASMLYVGIALGQHRA